MVSTWEDQRTLLREMLRGLRVGKGLTQEEVASRLARPQSYISKIESGERKAEFLDVRDYCLACDRSFIEFVRDFESTIS